MFKFPEVLPYNWELLKTEPEGRFWIVSNVMTVICSILPYSDGKEWVHLSVARRTRLPTWEELKQVKEVILGDRWCAQIFPPKAEYVNTHPYCLHLYSPADENYRPMPDFRIAGEI